MKERILEAAYTILSAEGHASLTTRRVCEAVGVSMPTLYHHYANRDELVKAVYGLALERFMAKKRSLALTDDPMLDLRKGCELVLDFTSQNKNVTAAVMNRALDDPGILIPGYELLRERVHRAAEAHRLKVSEREATAMIWSAVQGLVISTIASPEPTRSLAAVRRLVLDALLGAI
jgi:AcrR family transcriptional regulator